VDGRSRADVSENGNGEMSLESAYATLEAVGGHGAED
jgi:hypothetical protein